MNLRTTHDAVLEATDHLPAGATLVVYEFGWEDYEHLLADLDKRHSLRVSYNCGRLQVVSISPAHEHCIVIIENIVTTYCDSLNLTLEGYGRATWKRRKLGKGVEADACYYLENASRVIGDRTIDLEFDPAPDLVLEIDLTTESESKFPIYAGLSVPEIWRYDGKDIHFHELKNSGYVETSYSRFLPGLSREVLVELIELSKTQGQTAARKHLRSKLRSVR